MQYIGLIVYTIYIDFHPMGDIYNLLISGLHQVVIPVLRRIILRMQGCDKSMSYIINAAWNIRVECDKSGFICMTYVYFPGLYESVYEATNPLLLHSLRRLDV